MKPTGNNNRRAINTRTKGIARVTKPQQEDDTREHQRLAYQHRVTDPKKAF